jgi:hypothetical protein
MTYDPFDPFDPFNEEPPVYQDFFLKFDSAAIADVVLFDEQTNVEGDVVETVKVPRYAAVDVIGVIYKPTGKTLKTPEGPVPEMAPLEGWHVNVRHTEDAPELAAYAVTPTNPVRGWA